MTLYKLFIIYLLLVNFIAGVLFAYDKYCAKHQHRRIPERTLHLFELLGGFPVIILLMYLLRHKCVKSSYYLWTFLFAALWIAALLFIHFHQ